MGVAGGDFAELHFVGDAKWSDEKVRLEAAKYSLEAMTKREPVEACMLILLAPNCRPETWMLPLPRVQLGVGGCIGTGADAEQRTEGIKGIEAAIESERELVEIRL